jgi:hypothetical protein
MLDGFEFAIHDEKQKYTFVKSSFVFQFFIYIFHFENYFFCFF